MSALQCPIVGLKPSPYQRCLVLIPSIFAGFQQHINLQPSVCLFTFITFKHTWRIEFISSSTWIVLEFALRSASMGACLREYYPPPTHSHHHETSKVKSSIKLAPHLTSLSQMLWLSRTQNGPKQTWRQALALHVDKLFVGAIQRALGQRLNFPFKYKAHTRKNSGRVQSTSQSSCTAKVYFL